MKERSKSRETQRLEETKAMPRRFHFVPTGTFLNGLFLIMGLIFSALLASHARGATYVLAWDASPDTEVVGYNVYFGGTSRSYNANLIFGTDICNQLGCRAEINLGEGTWFLSVTAFNSDGIESDFSEELQVKAGTQEPNIIYPNGALKWIVGCGYEILWENFTSSKISINLLRNGLNVRRISKQVGNTGSFSWTVEAKIQPGDGYQVLVQGLNESAASQGDIEIVFPSVFSPQSGEALARGQAYEIQWDPDTFCGSYVNLDLLRHNKKVATIAQNVPNTGSFLWSVPEKLQSGAQYKIRIGSSISRKCYGVSPAYFKIQ